MVLGIARMSAYDSSTGSATASPSTDSRHESASRAKLRELLRTKKRRLGVVAPCMFSRRASNPAVPRSMNGAGSLKYPGPAAAASVAAVVEAPAADAPSPDRGSFWPLQAASTAAAPPTARSFR